MSNLNKQAIINLENTANYQPRSDLNIAFSTADRDSAVFKFNVTKNKKPLLLSEQNVKGHVAFSHSDKSFVKATLDFSEQDINGQFEVNVPNDLLKRPGTVTMQVYVAEKGNSEVIVAERILTFKIEQSIVSEISGETSLQYIIEFDELLEQVNQRMIAINDGMSNAEDYVTLINQAKEQGLSDIEIARSTSIQEINTLVASKLQELETKGDEYSTKFDNDKAEMDSKKEEFDLAVQGSGLVTTGQSDGWQKHKLTNDNGAVIRSEALDINELNSGYYESWNIINGPLNGDKGFFHIIVENSINNRKTIVATKVQTGQMFTKTIFTDGVDNGWREIVTLTDSSLNETTTGSQSKANTAESNAKTYARELVDKKTTLLFEGTANGVGKTINLSESMDNFYVLIIYASTPGGTHVDIASPYGSENIFIKSVNLPDNGNTGGAIFECGIQKTQRNQLTIMHDVSLDLSNFQGSGPNANRVKITRIVGVRK
ncbi:BppU family phage baseplate upper protein [Mammaliicoccus sciuri]|uniref:BppU family phage baseplate upper protein n=1 Tax=Mammaliicoccus sciuri TaxID=1296 RepID=UPI00265B972B|nr:BppU family phage baseplate upper protein [Mammaliicoccus sciuri]MDO0953394.1 BppU family phage baseplate upper protein [Mammaliicoccus sciuri]